jgi:hypothetical protein
MLFGSTSFSAAPFSSQYVQNVAILANGNRINITIGNVTTNIVTQVPVTGNKFNLATNPVSVISWNPIPPGVNQVWVPIDPDNP